MLRYKACRNSIVTLKLLNDSVTNEKRDDVVNDKYAKFRCDKARVVNIKNVKTGKLMKKDASIYSSGFHYRMGKVVKTYFDEDINKVYCSSIHYFKTDKAALSWFYRQCGKNFPDGKWTWWHENGQKLSEGTYKDKRFVGKWIWWYENGKKEMEGIYKDGKKDGKWIEWFSNGTFAKEYTR